MARLQAPQREVGAEEALAKADLGTVPDAFLRKCLVYQQWNVEAER